MPTCSMCGGNISPHDTTCPFCGNDLVPAAPSGGGMGGDDWDLLMDDAAPAPTAPTAPAAPAEPNPWAGFEDAPAGGPKEDWLLSADELSSLPPTPSPLAPPGPQAGWEPLPQQDYALPAWEPVAPQAPSGPAGNDVDFVFDLDPAAEAAPPPPAPVPPPQAFAPAWETPAAAPAPAPIAVPPPASARAAAPPPPVFVAPQPPPAVAPPGPKRVCPSCGKTYGADYRDDFCGCGAELVEARAAPPPAPVAPPAPKPLPPPAPVAGKDRPPPGTRCLVMYGADKKPVAYFPLNKDAMLIGRTDAVGGCFPEIDVSEWVDEATARRVSRKHALLLHVRGSDSFVLRPLPGNTGTQVNAEMCAGADVPLTVGARVILGGAVRFKFEVT